MTNIMHTIFDTDGKWRKVCSAVVEFDTVIFEAKWEAEFHGRTMIVKEGFMEECGAEAVAIVTKEGEVF